jgi:hypothetical protein
LASSITGKGHETAEIFAVFDPEIEPEIKTEIESMSTMLQSVEPQRKVALFTSYTSQ